MSNSGYDPFDYGLIKPQSDEQSTPAPQGDPEDVLFASESAPEAPAPVSDPCPTGQEFEALEASPTTQGLENALFGAPPTGDAAGPADADAFAAAPPPAFAEPAPAKTAGARPRRATLGGRRPVAPPASQSAETVVPPPWLRQQSTRNRRVPSPTAPGKQASRIRLQVATPGAAHYRGSSGGKLALPLMVLVMGLGGSAYIYWILNQAILAGLICAISLIGSMFCGVLFRNRI